MSKTLVSATNLTKHFPVSSSFFSRDQRVVRAVSDVSLQIQSGECFGLVGESGCGKSTLGRILVRLIEPTDGDIIYDQQNLLQVSGNDLRSLRRDLQMIFQNPFASLNPRKTIRDILSKPFRIHSKENIAGINQLVSELLDRVGLRPVEQFLYRYPNELSGGQRQRVVIARAIALHPRFVVADEPVSALDVSVRSGILNLLKDLQTDLGLTYLLISHDLSIVRSMCDRVAVMYLGKIVESAKTEELFRNPLHPYTRALLGATLIPDPQWMRTHSRSTLTGEVPSPISPPTGCDFHPRCPIRQVDCNQKEPVLEAIAQDHFVACWYTHLQEPWDFGPVSSGEVKQQ